MVELLDGTVIAQLGVPDMGLPIQYALTYPERRPSRSDRLDFTAYPGGLHFYAPDLEALPCLALAMRCARTRRHRADGHERGQRSRRAPVSGS